MASQEHFDRRILRSSSTLIDRTLHDALHAEAVDEPGISPANNGTTEPQDATENEGSISSFHKVYKFF